MSSPLAIPLFPPKLNPRAFLRNSTSTVCLESTIAKPSDVTLVKGLAKYIWNLLFGRNKLVQSIGHSFQFDSKSIGDFKNLSFEILIRIFSNFDCLTLCTLSLVSKGFYAIACSNNLWKTLYVERFGSIVRPYFEGRKKIYTFKSLYSMEGFRTELGIYDEIKHPLGPIDSYEDVEELPSEQQVLQFLIFMYEHTPTSYGSLLFTAVYLKRLHERIWILPFNWKRIVITVLMLAAKVWEEDAVWLDDFISVFPIVPIKDMNTMEKIVLALLEFGVSVKPKDYATVYFDLRAQVDPSTTLKPLDAETQAELELVNKRSEEMFSKKKKKNSFPLTRSDDRSDPQKAKSRSRFVLD